MDVHRPFPVLVWFPAAAVLNLNAYANLVPGVNCTWRTNSGSSLAKKRGRNFALAYG